MPISAQQKVMLKLEIYLKIVRGGRDECADTYKYDLPEERYEDLPVGCTLVSQTHVEQSVLFDHLCIREVRAFTLDLIMKVDIKRDDPEAKNWDTQPKRI